MNIACHHFRTVAFGFFSLVIFGLLSQPASGQDEPKIDFVKQIQPIFEKYCLSCHGEVKPKDFRIDLKDEAMDYIEAGAADDSTMYLVLISEDEDELMPPPDEENPLTPAEIQLVKDWINQGADWPAGVKMELPTTIKTDESGTSEDPVAETPRTEDTPAGAGAAEAGQGADDKAAPLVDPKAKRLQNATGSLHPAAVHMPIGLLMAAGLFALLSLRGNFVMSDCAYYCLWLGTLGAIAACVTGYYFSPMERQGTIEQWSDWMNQDHKVFWHRTTGIIVTALACVVALFAASSRSKDPDNGLLWKLGVIVLAAGIGLVGHQGGELTHGKRHYDDLKALGADWFPGIFGEGAILGEKPKPAVDKVTADDAKADNAKADDAKADDTKADDSANKNAEADATSDDETDDESDESNVGKTSEEN